MGRNYICYTAVMQNSQKINLISIFSNFDYRRSFTDVTRPICNAFIVDSAARTCRVGAYEKEKGFAIGEGDGTTFIDAGKNVLLLK